MRTLGILIALAGLTAVVGQIASLVGANDPKNERVAGIVVLIFVTLAGIVMSLTKQPPTDYDKKLNLLAKPFLIFVLYGFWFVATTVPILCLILLKTIFEGVMFVSVIVALLGIPLLLFSIVGSLWLSLTTVRHLCDEDRAFLKSLILSITDLRLLLMFLPFIGRVFTPNDENQHCSVEHNN